MECLNKLDDYDAFKDSFNYLNNYKAYERSVLSLTCFISYTTLVSNILATNT
jgi:hypothetical protein